MSKTLNYQHRQKAKLSIRTIVLLCLLNMYSNSAIANSAYGTVDALPAYEGNPESQFKLALYYAENNNSEQAFYWYKQAARQGNADAQYNLGHFYYKGTGTHKDQNNTTFWWSKAAHQGYLPAQHNMGLAYANGIGVEKNTHTAKRWFALCAQSGSEQCKKQIASQNKQPSSKEQNIHLEKSESSLVIGKRAKQAGSNEWQKTSLDLPVWIYKKYTSIKDQTVTLTGDNVRARLQAIINKTNIINELAIGTELTFIQEQEKWVQAKLNNVPAWAFNASTAKESITPIKLNKKTYIDAYTFPNRESDNKWLFSLADDSYTLQLGSFDTQKSLDSFLASKPLKDGDKYHTLLSERHSVEWKYVLLGSFKTKQLAEASKQKYQFKHAHIVKAGDIQQQRCSAWKTTLPPPKQLDMYCVD